MKAINKKIVIILIVMTTGFASLNHAFGQDKNPVARIAKLQIDSAQLKNYEAALKLHAETAVRVEPGVITLYAVSEKTNPTHITVFEIYASSDAYQAHLKTAHFFFIRKQRRIWSNPWN